MGKMLFSAAAPPLHHTPRLSGLTVLQTEKRLAIAVNVTPPLYKHISIVIMNTDLQIE